MSRYLVELYRPSSHPESLQGAADRLADSARHLSGEGTPVRYVDTIFLPTDETCLHLLEAGSEEDVRAVARRAGIDVDRIVPAEQVEQRDVSSRPQGPETGAVPPGPSSGSDTETIVRRARTPLVEESLRTTRAAGERS